MPTTGASVYVDEESGLRVDQSGLSRNTEPIEGLSVYLSIHLSIKRSFKNWPTRLWSWLVEICRAARAGQKLEQGFCSAVLRQNSFSSQENPLSLLIRPSTDWARPTHSTESHVLYSKSTVNDIHIYKMPSLQLLGWRLTKQLGTIA